MTTRSALHLIAALCCIGGAAWSWTSDVKLTLAFCAFLAGLLLQTVWDLWQIDNDTGLWEGWRARIAAKAEAWAKEKVAMEKLEGDETLQTLRTALGAFQNMSAILTVQAVMRVLDTVLKLARNTAQANEARVAIQTTLTEFTGMVASLLPVDKVKPDTLEGYVPIITLIVAERDQAVQAAELDRTKAAEAEETARKANVARVEAVDRTANFLALLPALLDTLLAVEIRQVEQPRAKSAGGLVRLKDAGRSTQAVRRRGDALPGGLPEDGLLLGGLKDAAAAVIAWIERLKLERGAAQEKAAAAEPAVEALRMFHETLPVLLARLCALDLATQTAQLPDTGPLEGARLIECLGGAVAKVETVVAGQVRAAEQGAETLRQQKDATVEAERKGELLRQRLERFLAALPLFAGELQTVTAVTLAQFPAGTEGGAEDGQTATATETADAGDEPMLLALSTEVRQVKNRAERAAAAFKLAQTELTAAQLLPVVAAEAEHFSEEVAYVMQYLLVQICMRLALHRYNKLQKDHGKLVGEAIAAIDTAIAKALTESNERRDAIDHPLAGHLKQAFGRVVAMRDLLLGLLGFAARSDIPGAHKHALTQVDSVILAEMIGTMPESAQTDIKGRVAA